MNFKCILLGTLTRMLQKTIRPMLLRTLHQCRSEMLFNFVLDLGQKQYLFQNQ